MQTFYAGLPMYGAPAPKTLSTGQTLLVVVGIFAAMAGFIGGIMYMDSKMR